MNISRTSNGYALDQVEALNLPPRQSLALLYKSHGLTQEQIADRMDCSADNARNLIRELHFKLRTNRETALITRAFQNGYLRFLNLIASAFLIALTTVSSPTTAANNRDPDQLRIRHRQHRTTRNNGKKITPWWDEECALFFIEDDEGAIKPWL